MKLVDMMIIEIKEKISKSKEEILWLTGSELTKKNYELGNLYLELRKYVDMANSEDNYTFYCSMCGEKFNDLTERNRHSAKRHKKN